LHHSDYPQFDHQAQPFAYQAPQPAPQSSLEEMMKAFVQSTNKNLQELKNGNQELKNATMANIRDIQELKSSVTRIEGQIGHLVTELNRIEEEELQSQLMIERHYMSDEDDSENSYHEHAQVTTTLESEEIVDNNEEQIEKIERVEHHKKSQPLTYPNMPSDMKVNTEAPAYITAPLETHQEPKASSLVCLQEPSYVKILKDLSTQVRKSRNHISKKILRSKQFYIRWRNIIPEGYEVLKKKGWKGLVGHQYDRGQGCKVFSSSLFSTLHSTNSFFPFSVLVFSFVFFVF
jgi:hypothetical protein